MSCIAAKSKLNALDVQSLKHHILMYLCKREFKNKYYEEF